MTGARPARLLSRGGFYLVVAVFTLFAALPFYVILITAFKRNSDLFAPTNNPFWFTEAPTFGHIQLLFADTLFVRWLANSFLVGGIR